MQMRPVTKSGVHHALVVETPSVGKSIIPDRSRFNVFCVDFNSAPCDRTKVKVKMI